MLRIVPLLCIASCLRQVPTRKSVSVSSRFGFFLVTISMLVCYHCCIRSRLSPVKFIIEPQYSLSRKGHRRIMKSAVEQVTI